MDPLKQSQNPYFPIENIAILFSLKDVVKGLSQCGLFLKSRKTLVERVIL